RLSDTTEEMLSSFTPRHLVLDRLLDKVRTHRIVLVKGTPASGKTSLLRLLQRHLKNTKEFDIKVLPNGITSVAFETRQYRNLAEKEVEGAVVNELGYDPLDTPSAKPTILLVDEAQTTYWSNWFWNSLVKSVNDGVVPRLFIILFSS